MHQADSFGRPALFYAVQAGRVGRISASRNGLWQLLLMLPSRGHGRCGLAPASSGLGKFQARPLASGTAVNGLFPHAQVGLVGGRWQC